MAASAAGPIWLLATAVGTAAQGPNWIVDRSVEGRLEARDPTVPDGIHYDDHRIRLRAGERVRLSLASEDFDPVVRIYIASDMHEPLAENDDEGEGSFNSRLTFGAPEEGDYVVRVLSFGSRETGAYRLRTEPLPPLPAPVTAATATTTSTWRTFEGSLAASDPDRDGRHFDDYQIALRQGDEVVIRLDSEEFDPMVQILPADSRDGDALDGDDDSGPDADSLLGFRALQSGNYIVRVTSFDAGGTGAYRLRIGD